MKLTYVTYTRDPNRNLVFNFREGEFMGVSSEEEDLSFIENSIKSFQFDAEGNQNFMRKIVDGEEVETTFQALNDIGFGDKLKKVFSEALEKRKVKPWNDEEIMEELRMERDEKLANVDYKILQAIENGVTPDPKVVAYRQALRDLPNQIAAGKVSKPTCKKESADPWVADYYLVFDQWPKRP